MKIAYLLAKIGAETAENEQHLVEIARHPPPDEACRGADGNEAAPGVKNRNANRPSYSYSFLDILSPGDALVRARERPPGAQDAYGLRGAFALRGVDDRAQELRVLVEELLRNRHQQPSGISI